MKNVIISVCLPGRRKTVRKAKIRLGYQYNSVMEKLQGALGEDKDRRCPECGTVMIREEDEVARNMCIYVCTSCYKHVKVGRK